MTTFLQEVRHSFQMLARTPGFTSVAALSLALGIGVNSAIFSLNDALLWRPLPVRDPGSLVSVTTDSRDDRGVNRFVSYPNYRDLRATSESFDGLVAHQVTTVSFARSRQATREMRIGVLASDNFFDVLGITPTLGRSFTPEEGRVPGRDAVVVLDHAFWKNTLGEDSSILGRAVVVNGIDVTVIGVAPAGFTGMETFIRPSFYLPVAMTRQLNATALGAARGGNDPLEDREARAFVVKGRLKPSVSQTAAQTELALLWNRLVQQYPDANRNRAVAVRSELQERRRIDPGNATVSAMVTPLVALVLVIACANVATLLLGRAHGRSREIAVRLALGVSRMRLLRQLLLEGLSLALIGCSLGLGFAYGGIRFLSSSLQATVPNDLLLVSGPQLDRRVLLFSLVAALLSTLVLGLAPAWQSLRTQLVGSLRSSEPNQTTRRRTVGRNVLVTAQVALSMVLLVAAGTLLGGYRNSVNLSPGFRTDDLIMMSTDTSLTGYTPAKARDFYRALGDRVRAMPGVASATVTSAIPFDSAGVERVIPEGFRRSQERDDTLVASAVVDEHYFSTLKIDIVRGRAFRADDNEGSRRVAIVNDAFARTYWPDQDPIGKRIRLTDDQGPWLEVVGVTKTGKYLQIGEAPRPFLYQPLAQDPRAQMSLLTKTASADPVSLGAPLRDVVRALDLNLPVFNLRSFSSFYERRALGPQLMLTQVVSTAGLLGVTLALVGLYGLVAYSVGRRTREIGIRMAMGAETSDVLKMVLRQGLTLSLTGIAVGGVASLGVTLLLTSNLAGVASPNVATYIAVPAAFIGLTVAASYFPARRASAVDPLRALRHE